MTGNFTLKYRQVVCSGVNAIQFVGKPLLIDFFNMDVSDKRTGIAYGSGIHRAHLAVSEYRMFMIVRYSLFLKIKIPPKNKSKASCLINIESLYL